MKYFDPEFLRTFVAFADSGTLAQAARLVGRTTSTVTVQMQRLEEIAGVPLLAADGRRRVLTDAGERLLGHARRILSANEEAWLNVSGAATEGRICLGLTQDFADYELPTVLRQFVRSHPQVRIDLRIGSSSELAEEMATQQIDVLLAVRNHPEPDEIGLLREKMLWFGPSDMPRIGLSENLPIALLEPPCAFRTAVIQALNNAGRQYRIATTSRALSGLSAALRAGIAVTARTRHWRIPGLSALPETLRLPSLPMIDFSIRVRHDADPTAHRLGALLLEGLSGQAVAMQNAP